MVSVAAKSACHAHRLLETLAQASQVQRSTSRWEKEEREEDYLTAETKLPWRSSPPLEHTKRTEGRTVRRMRRRGHVLGRKCVSLIGHDWADAASYTWSTTRYEVGGGEGEEEQRGSEARACADRRTF